MRDTGLPIIKVENLSYIYGEGTPYAMHALRDVNVEIEKGEIVGIIGHTGSGKSTLIQHLNGLIRPTSGRVLLDGKDIWENPKEIRSVRFRVGLVFQYPEYQLFEETVYKDIAFGPTNMGLSPEEVDRRVRETAELVGVKAQHLDRSPFDLSGGEKRRAAIAGVMAMQPDVLVLDEPTAGLDPAGRDKIFARVKEYQKATGSTVIIVSHSMEDMARMADRVLVMAEGQVKMFDRVEKVYAHGEELSAIGLNVPQITRIFMGLHARGLLIGENAYTVDAAEEILLKALGKAGDAHA